MVNVFAYGKSWQRKIPGSSPGGIGFFDFETSSILFFSQATICTTFRDDSQIVGAFRVFAFSVRNLLRFGYALRRNLAISLD